MPTGTIADGAAVVEEILAYGEGILQVRPGLSRCPICDAPADGAAFFRRHAIRSRTFWVIVERVVRNIPCSVTRWKCPCCKRTFTWQPPFALPHKRYTRPQMQERAQEYTANDAVDYREAVEQDGMPVCHEATAAEPIPAELPGTCAAAQQKDDGTGRQLSHATLHRWITTLGGLTRTVGRALVLIRQKGTAVAFFRSLVSIRIAAGKYRSEGRKELLRMCRVLDRVKVLYEELFSTDLFPMAGTASGWT